MSTDNQPNNTPEGNWQSWLKAEMTLTYPRWVFVGAAGLALLLLLAALD